MTGKRVAYRLMNSTDEGAFEDIGDDIGDKPSPWPPCRSLDASLTPQMPSPTPDQISTTRASALSAAAARGGGKGAGRVAGKVAIVTGVGPASGIGTKSARLLAREGAKALYLVDVSGDLPAFAAALAKEFPGTKVTHVVGDAADESVIKAIVDRAVAENGHLDVYFANAGIVQPRPKGVRQPTSALEAAALNMTASMRTTDEIPGDEFDEVMRINVKGPWLAGKYAPGAMARTTADKTVPGGSLILTASVAGRRAGAGPVIYSASKAAVVSLAQTSSYELYGQNVRVNAICPGLIETPMTQATFELASKAGKREAIGQLNPLLRYGVPEEIAQAALWLASDDSSYVNGQAICVDGGLSASHPYVRPKPRKAKL